MLIGGDRGAAVRHAQRVTGQTFALASMIATRQPFAAIAQQLLAARGSIDSLLFRLVELELRDRVPNPVAREEIDGLLRTAFGREGRHRSPKPRHGPSRPTTRAALILEGTSAP
jgi:DNA-binding FrmR family transcriptional regulator